MSDYVIGVDYGTDSCRAVVIDAANGKEIASNVFWYPRWKEGKYCAPLENMFRQHPLDYLEGLEQSVRNALDGTKKNVRDNIRGIAIDTTGSTPGPVDRKGTPLALLPEFSEDPDAMFVLWKDHTAVAEAAEINSKAGSWGGTDYTKYEGGIYSSEWFWAKIMHVYRSNARVSKAAFSWVEHCDWMPAVLTGNTDPLTMKRSRCAAGHKAMWHEEFDGLPSEEFLLHLDPLLAGLRRNLFRETFTAEKPAGTLCPEWAQKLGLSTDVVVAVGAFDAHMGAVGAQIVPRALV
ncbi:MAG: ribulokinase, partial [Spirochaetales bacterium]|nr:ribulokinase [Spirochaetales bacterium]